MPLTKHRLKVKQELYTQMQHVIDYRSFYCYVQVLITFPTCIASNEQATSWTLTLQAQQIALQHILTPKIFYKQIYSHNRKKLIKFIHCIEQNIFCSHTLEGKKMLFLCKKNNDLLEFHGKMLTKWCVY